MKSLKLINDQYAQLAPTLGFNAQEIDQVSPEWFAMRLGVITGTGSHRVCGSKAVRATYMKQIISEIIMGEPREQVSAKPLAWGCENEPRARATYTMELEDKFERDGEPTSNAIITEIPFIFKDLKMRVGASLDGALYGIDATVEIKCPFNPEHHIEIVETTKIKKEYEFQIQHGMYCADAEHVHFGSFDPRFRKKKLVVKVIERNEAFMHLFDDAYAEFSYEVDKRLRDFWESEYGAQWNLKEYKNLQR